MNQTSFNSLESERLILRRFADEDLAAFLAYLNDPLVARYQTWETYTEQEARAVIEKQKSLEPGTRGQWFTFALELKETGALVGHIALQTQEDERLQAEIGFTFARQYHGLGLACEASTRVLDFVFQELAMHRVIAIADCENEKSIALLGRLGMRREGHFIENVWFKGKWGGEYLYAILRDEWLRRRSHS
ncbi:MAG TPA: GNAT family N-acetyltransferase [Pyrinomonadaceae bacterium]|jgi:RimJ/RimL family protein N-acetyltransferase|nr:GNAT family N-acetyltransferase [Pyrinomonadaceae bacterium]